MNEKDNKLPIILGVLIVVFLAIYFGGGFIIDKVADRVIQKLQKEYSPSPYGPGIDPDKLDFQPKKAS